MRLLMSMLWMVLGLGAGPAGDVLKTLNSLVQVAPGGSLYLGQQPPGTVPRVFAPGVVSRGNIHSRLTISSDGREMFWNTVDLTTFSTRILSVRIADGR